MPLSASVVFAVLCVSLILGFHRVRGLWSGQGFAELEGRWRRMWPYGEATLQDWLRATIALYIGACFATVAYPAAVLLPPADRSMVPVLQLWLWTGFTGFMVMALLAITIVLFNMPKRLVFPFLRGQDGLITRWRRSRSNARDIEQR